MEMLWSALEALVCAIDGRVGTPRHSIRVAELAVNFGTRLQLSAAEITELRLGALLHDIGKVHFSEKLLLADDSQRGAYRDEIRNHTVQGAELISAWPQLALLNQYILCHQEWIDGSGYPSGISGEQIATTVQVLSIVDVYEALTSPRDFRGRGGLSGETALDTMRRMSGLRWRSELFDAFASGIGSIDRCNGD